MSVRAKFDVSRFLEKLFVGITEGKLAEHVPADDVIRLLNEVRRCFILQPMLLKLGTPVNICGDLHGQFNDLMRIMDSEGFPHCRSYLFLGDYVDRGAQSMELILFMFACKVRYPKNFYMLRGNHETSSINKSYGFYKNVLDLYRNDQLYDAFNKVFDCMPLAALISGRILCMHGGLSPPMLEAKNLRVIDAIERPLPDSLINPANNQMAVDLLWADPDVNVPLFAANRRGVGHIFGQEVIDRIRTRFGVDLIIRAHQVVLDGHEFFNGTPDSGLITLFSAPHYCGMYDNSGAIVRVAVDLGVSFKRFEPAFKSSPSRG
uniref:Serine/threonine-protein phosphatase n=1 Tax=Meloidogyne enterolobii TaxID=390850 RepID=A0A6V7XZ25_MELEN|nr:unnamed protein product [Meloidogyne enterolobii]